MNQTFYIRYNNNEVVKVATHFDSKRLRRELPLNDVADIIAAFFMNASPEELGKYTLHEIIDGVEGPALCIGLPLTDLTSSRYLIKSKCDTVKALASEDLVTKLIRMGVKLETSRLEKVLSHIMHQQPMTYLLLKNNHLTLDEVDEIIKRASYSIMSQTRNEIRLRNHIFFNEPLPVGQGQLKTAFYMTFTDSLQIMFAKVFHSAKDSYMREVSIRRKIGKHENIIEFCHAFEIDSTRHAIIMPYMASSLATCKLKWSILPFPGLATVARDCFNALRHIHQRGICFMDVKPSNIMLESGIGGKVCLVDFGAAATVGAPIMEYSPLYCLDLDVMVVSYSIDWRCLGTTLAECSGFIISESMTALNLIEDVKGCSKTPIELQKLICACLSVRPDGTLIGKYVDGFVESQRGKSNGWSFVYD